MVPFSIFTALCNHHYYLILEHYHHLKRKACAHQQSFPPPFPPLSSPYNHWSTFCFYEFVYLDISYKWNHIIHGSLWLASFTWHNVLLAYLYLDFNVVSCLGEKKTSFKSTSPIAHHTFFREIHSKHGRAKQNQSTNKNPLCLTKSIETKHLPASQNITAGAEIKLEFLLMLQLSIWKKWMHSHTENAYWGEKNYHQQL